MLIVFIIRYHLHLKKTMQTRGKWSELTMGELTIISLNLLPHCRTAAAHHREAGFTNATHHTHHTIWILRPLSSLECQHSLGYREYHWNPNHCDTIEIIWHPFFFAYLRFEWGAPDGTFQSEAFDERCDKRPTNLPEIGALHPTDGNGMQSCSVCQLRLVLPARVRWAHVRCGLRLCATWHFKYS